MRLNQKLSGGLFEEIFSKSDGTQEGKSDGTQTSNLNPNPNRMGFKLPQLGALFVANEKGQLVDEKSRAVLLKEGPEYKALLKKYTELPHDGIALIVANAFMRAEHRELYTYEREAEHHELDTYSKLGAVFNLCACG